MADNAFDVSVELDFDVAFCVAEGDQRSHDVLDVGDGGVFGVVGEDFAVAGHLVVDGLGFHEVHGLAQVEGFTQVHKGISIIR